MMPPLLERFLTQKSRLVDRALNRFLRRKTQSPRAIHDAMRYSIFAGGKRLRPALVIAGAELCGKPASLVLPTACALEMIHTYSLIHDDLPAMDDDDLRRGRPTNHKVYGEAAAILAGDALLTQAFELVGMNLRQAGLSGTQASALLTQIARDAGTPGMVGGQGVDIALEDGRWKKSSALRAQGFANAKIALTYIHLNKTAALIRGSLVAGAALAKAGPDRLRRLARYGDCIGLAFQVADDILDIEGDKKKLGKRGSDRQNQKLTYPALYGLDASRKKARALVDEAKRCLKPFGKRAEVLIALADYIVQRDH